MRRALRILLFIELTYLLAINGALRLPLTQTIINDIKPDKFYVSWEKAWSWYPFRVHARGISANGQSRSQQWQVEAAAASASIAILPLLAKRVWLDKVSIADVDYRQRPRLKPEKDYTDRLEFFPAIEGREVRPADTSQRKKKRPWHLAIDAIEASGNYDYWIYNMRGGASGSLRADMTFQTRGGPFSLAATAVDLKLQPHVLNGKHPIFEGGEIRGKLGFAPFVPRENKGIKMLGYAIADVDIDIDVNELGFISLFTSDIAGLEVEGEGRMTGHLHLDRGNVLPPTSLLIDAKDLAARMLQHRVEGNGEVRLASAENQETMLELSLLFDQLDVYRDAELAPLLDGRDLRLALHAGSNIMPSAQARDQLSALFLSVEGIDAPDLALFQHYFSPQWPLSLEGGRGKLKLIASLARGALNLDLNITSDAANIALQQYRFTSDLDFAFKLDNPSVASNATSLEGSYIEITDARLQRKGGEGSDAWSALFRINDGTLALLDKTQIAEDSATSDVMQILANSGAGQLLADAKGDLAFAANISSLAWISVLLSDRFHSSFGGSGDLQGLLKLEDGLPQPGTKMEIASTKLEVGFLDYIGSGEGDILLAVDETGGTKLPDWHMQADLRKANLRRRAEARALVHDADITLKATIQDLNLDPAKLGRAAKDLAGQDLSLSLLIDSARISDMPAFNSYLPPDAPIAITGGTAELNADIMLRQDDADGWLKLRSEGLQLQADEQSIEGDLSADIRLVGGEPEKMYFDISGSTILLDNVSVVGENKNFEDKGWYALIELEEGLTTWSKPLVLDASANIRISDSRPIVALFDNRIDAPKWLQKLLTIEDVSGTARLEAADHQFVIPSAQVVGDKIALEAKGVINEKRRDGAIYARYRKLDVVLKIVDGEKNLDLFGARGKFDEYIIPR